MKRTVSTITGEGQVALITENLPEAGPNDITIQVVASLMSPGTELMMLENRRANPNPEAKPEPFGYAVAGVITHVPADMEDLKLGQKVIGMGAGKALHADIVQVPRNLVVAIPEGVKMEEAVYACLGATAMQSVRRSEPELGEYGLVLGLGIVGNLAAQLYQIAGARVVGWDGLKGRLDIANQCGIYTAFDPFDEKTTQLTKEFASPYGFDFSLFAFGGNATSAYQSVLSLMKESQDGHAMGKMVLVGGCQVMVEGGAAGGNVDLRIASRTGAGYHDPEWENGKEYPKVFVPFTTKRNLEEILLLMSEGRLNVSPMTTHRLPLSQVAEAAELLQTQPNDTLGIVLTQESSSCES
ncbi:zinc-binding alcohol dehydrogenase [Kiritimatiellota bacterium B12222]|nr:zinc-binding alcohol dehydrogenase [Kiritimatiellota bacterium B12222]